MKKLVKLSIALSIGLSFQQIFAAVAYDDSYIAKVVVGREGDGAQCDHDAQTAYKLLQEAGVELFGWPAPLFFVSGQNCKANVLLIFKSPIPKASIVSAFAQANLEVAAVVDNYKATYMGYIVRANYSDGSTDYCERRQERLARFTSWNEGFQYLTGELGKVVKADAGEKRRWLSENFDCDNLGGVDSLSVALDLANQDICPLNTETANSCFIARGLQQFVLKLE